jgi:hypothetical protein
MDSSWVGVIGTLSGLVVGALIESARSKLSFSRERHWARLEEQRHHLEAVYETLEKTRESYNATVADAAYHVSQGKPPANPSSASKVPWVRLRLLVHLYAPTLGPMLKVVEKAGPLVAITAIDVTLGARRTQPVKERLERLQRVSDAFTTTVDNMRDAIVALSRSSDAEMSSLASAPVIASASWRARFRKLIGQP